MSKIFKYWEIMKMQAEGASGFFKAINEDCEVYIELTEYGDCFKVGHPSKSFYKLEYRLANIEIIDTSFIIEHKDEDYPIHVLNNNNLIISHTTTKAVYRYTLKAIHESLFVIIREVE